MKKLLLFALLVVFSLADTIKDIHDIDYELKDTIYVKSEKKHFIYKLLGEPLETNIIFLPTASYTYSNTFFNISYVGFTYKSCEISRFINSYGDATYGLLYHRVINLSPKLSINYFLGLLYGYYGKLSTSPRLPFSNTFLFKGNVNPGAGLSLNYKLYNKINLNIRHVPNVTFWGLSLVLN